MKSGWFLEPNVILSCTHYLEAKELVTAQTLARIGVSASGNLKYQYSGAADVHTAALHDAALQKLVRGAAKDPQQSLSVQSVLSEWPLLRFLRHHQREIEHELTQNLAVSPLTFLWIGLRCHVRYGESEASVDFSPLAHRTKSELPDSVLSCVLAAVPAARQKFLAQDEQKRRQAARQKAISEAAQELADEFLPQFSEVRCEVLPQGLSSQLALSLKSPYGPVTFQGILVLPAPPAPARPPANRDEMADEAAYLAGVSEKLRQFLVRQTIVKKLTPRDLPEKLRARLAAYEKKVAFLPSWFLAAPPENLRYEISLRTGKGSLTTPFFTQKDGEEPCETKWGKRAAATNRKAKYDFAEQLFHAANIFPKLQKGAGIGCGDAVLQAISEGTTIELHFSYAEETEAWQANLQRALKAATGSVAAQQEARLARVEPFLKNVLACAVLQLLKENRRLSEQELIDNLRGVNKKKAWRVKDCALSGKFDLVAPETIKKLLAQLWEADLLTREKKTVTFALTPTGRALLKRRAEREPTEEEGGDFAVSARARRLALQEGKTFADYLPLLDESLAVHGAFQDEITAALRGMPAEITRLLAMKKQIEKDPARQKLYERLRRIH